MPEAVRKAGLSTLDRLRSRGDRAVAAGAEATRILRINISESQRIRNRIDQIHHRGERSFETLLEFGTGRIDS